MASPILFFVPGGKALLIFIGIALPSERQPEKFILSGIQPGGLVLLVHCSSFIAA
jgi:hypothetical protein